MTDFAFRIRAIDDTGAFADRDFSIKVRNTVTDRMVLVDATNAYTSPDGVNWTTRVNQGGIGVAHGGGVWLVWTSTATYRTSPDGVNWTTRTLPTWSQFTTPHFSYANGRWMAIWVKTGNPSSSPSAWTSLDGVTWTEGGVVAGAISAGRIIYGNGRWFACNNTSSTGVHGYTSTDDGVNWTTVSTGAGTANVIDAIFINGLWILVDFTGTRVLTSSNLTTWTARSLSGLVGNAARIVYGNGRLVIPPFAPSGNPVSGYDKVMTSEDGVTWTARTFPAFKPGSSGTTGPHTPNIVYTHGQFYMVSNSGGSAANTDGFRVSTDGITWTRPATPTGFYNGIARMSLS